MGMYSLLEDRILGRKALRHYYFSFEYIYVLKTYPQCIATIGRVTKAKGKSMSSVDAFDKLPDRYKGNATNSNQMVLYAISNSKTGIIATVFEIPIRANMVNAAQTLQFIASPGSQA